MSPLASLNDVFAALKQALEPERLRWYVFGAQAVLAHGLPRLTADVDVTIDPEGRDNASILRLLATASIRSRAPELPELVATSRLLPLVHDPSRIAVDVVLAGPGIEQDFLARAVVVDLAGVQVPVLCPEDLIATKAVAGRRKDTEDILGVLAQQGARLDVASLRRTLAAFDEALEEPRATRTFDRVFRRHLRRTEKA